MIIKNAIMIPLFMVLVLVSGCNYSQGQTSVSPTLTSTSATPTTNKPPPTKNTDIPKDPLEDVVIKADCIVSGTITNEKDAVIQVSDGKITYMIATLAVDKMIKGDPSVKEIFIKEDRYVVGGPYFPVSAIVLLCLHKEPDDIYTVMYHGDIWEKSSTVITHPDLPYVIGRIIKIMRINNIPIALPENERPPEPADPISPPKGFPSA